MRPDQILINNFNTKHIQKEKQRIVSFLDYRSFINAIICSKFKKCFQTSSMHEWIRECEI
jgi:hypothetical protein